MIPVDIGSDQLTSTEEIWQPASGETRRMLGLEVLGRLINELLVLRDFYTPNGELNA